MSVINFINNIYNYTFPICSSNCSAEGSVLGKGAVLLAISSTLNFTAPSIC